MCYYYHYRQNAIKVDKNKFLAIACCSRKEFHSIVDVMVEYDPNDNSEHHVMV